jgi:hypothetical protein
MKLLTKEIIKKLPPIGTHAASKAEDIPVVCKFFNPSGTGTWYITEYSPEERLFFGLCCIHEAELGYVSQDELEQFRGRFGLSIERDLYSGKMTLADAMRKEGY